MDGVRSRGSARVWLKTSRSGKKWSAQKHVGDEDHTNLCEYESVVFYPGWLKCQHKGEDDVFGVEWYPSDQVIAVDFP